MSSLKPNEPLIYERANGVVYAKYRDRPDIERWIIGGDSDAVARAQGGCSYADWQRLCDLAEQNSALKKQLEKTLLLYYTIKDG